MCEKRKNAYKIHKICITSRFGWFAIDEDQYYDLSKVETEIRGNEKHAHTPHTGKSTLTIYFSVSDSFFRRISKRCRLVVVVVVFLNIFFYCPIVFSEYDYVLYRAEHHNIIITPMYIKIKI